MSWRLKRNDSSSARKNGNIPGGRRYDLEVALNELSEKINREVKALSPHF
jgi:hypothetical protein